MKGRIKEKSKEVKVDWFRKIEKTPPPLLSSKLWPSNFLFIRALYKLNFFTLFLVAFFYS